MKFDVLIIGSGLGGLTCGAILSKKGFNVCVLEKNPRIGGCLQSYYKDGGLFDTGVHYIGSLSKGQTIYQIFDYLGILSKLSLIQLDVNGFDKISFANDDTIYPFAQGYDNFIESLSQQFPDERKNIIAYCDKIKYICDKFPLYKLTNGNFIDKLDVIELDTYTEICKITSNTKLQNVLAGNNPLYSGVKNRTPFYIHSLILNSYIESAWKLTQGGSELANALTNVIKNAGGKVLPSKEVIKLVEKDSKIQEVHTSDGEVFYPEKVISAIHPTQTIEMVETNKFRPAFYNRFHSFENTIAPFIVNVTLKQAVVGEINSNRYHYLGRDVWDYQQASGTNWPKMITIFPALEHKGVYSSSIMSTLSFSHLKKWENTYNCFYTKGNRGQDYEDFKAEYAERLIDETTKIYPQLKSAIEHTHTITGLTYRDHTGVPEGSFYGISKDSKDPLRTFIIPQTKIPNLFFTGQNLNVHGVYGVIITSLITCSALVDINNLLKEIRNE